jgi:hypothetical protein
MQVYAEMKTNVKDAVITLVWLALSCKQKHVFGHCLVKLHGRSGLLITFLLGSWYGLASHAL